MKGEQELVCDLLNGANSNDLERTLTLFSSSHHSDDKHLTNGYRYGYIVTIEGEYETAPKLQNGTNFNDLE